MKELFKIVSEFLGFKLFTIKKEEVFVVDLLIALLAVLVAYFLIRWVRRLAVIAVKRKKITTGQQFAYTQISKYFIVVIAFILVLNSLKLDLTWLLLGSSAFLLGIGLGLQQMFNDLVSGFFLLFEDTVRVDDIIEVEDMVCRMKDIGIRTSKVVNRDGIVVVIPNSKIVSNSVINWTTDGTTTRFIVKVGVAYGSNVSKVRNILLACASRHSEINTAPKPNCRFVDFGNSSLDFELLFWSKNNFRVEDVKSDIRFMIDSEFRKNDIVIPFPQRDIHVITKKGDLPEIEDDVVENTSDYSKSD
jgi:small-conductance mechanosensitive channel